MTIEQGTEEWRAQRRQGIGGSEVAALYPKMDSKTGTHHPWLSAYKLWAIKTGRLAEDDAHPIASPQLWWGTRLEPIVRDAYQVITGRSVTDGVTLARHPEVPCIIANTDGQIAAIDDRGPGVYEGKTTKFWSRDEWADGKTPIYYQAQLQLYCACTGLQWGSVAAYVAGEYQPILYRDIERNDAFIERMLERVDRWWTKHVIGDTPPEVDGSAQTREVITTLFPEPTGETVRMGDAWLEIRDELDTVRSEIKSMTARKDQLENKIRAAIGSATFAELPDGSGWSYATTVRNGYEVKPATYRQLRTVKDMNKAKKP